jgi:phage shock protein PspC (stress-responsive transcriptional regulator)
MLPETRARLAGQGLVRPRRGRLVAGVCAGLARRFDTTPSIVRLVFLLSLFLPGTQVVVYLVLWVLMPNEDRAALST